jgi:hypothetical protein
MKGPRAPDAQTPSLRQRRPGPANAATMVRILSTALPLQCSAVAWHCGTECPENRLSACATSDGRGARLLPPPPSVRTRDLCLSSRWGNRKHHHTPLNAQLACTVHEKKYAVHINMRMQASHTVLICKLQRQPRGVLPRHRAQDTSCL